jgi:hypothetical protein
MTLSVQKPAGRHALESPYKRESDRSMDRAMSRGVMPKSLDALVAWLMACEASELPTELHKHEVWRDYGEHAEGGSALGAPAYDDGFRRLIENSPSALDADGYYQTPLRAALSRLRRRWPIPANHIDVLLRMKGDWHLLAEQAHLHDQVARIYLAEALRMLWREHSERSVRLE